VIETVRSSGKRVSRRKLDVRRGIEPYVEDEEILELTGSDGRPRVRVVTLPAPLIVLGKGSDPEGELELDLCLADGIPLQRRRGGGCAVVLDPGCVLVSTAIRAAGIGHNKAHFGRLTDWMTDALATIGFPNIKGDGISDLVLGDRKVAGTCLYRRKDLLLYSASLLVTPDVERMERYLAHPPREPAYRRGRAHRDFVGGLVKDAGTSDAAMVAEQLSAALLPMEL
jgi:lipoate---protein ligase